MTSKLSGLALAIALAACLVGCNRADDQSEDPGAQNATDEFRNGVPRAETILMALPKDSGGQTLAQSNELNAKEESSSQALLGEQAEWYDKTRAVTWVVNGAARAVGHLVSMVLTVPPTTIGENQAVWGPWEDPLDPVAWRITITRIAAHTFQYTFEGRPRVDPSAAFVTVLAGTHIPTLNARGRVVARFGSGSFTLDWDARATLPMPDDNVGQVDYTYQHVSVGDSVEITANFRQVKDEDRPGQRVDAKYAFTQQPQGPGSMDFVFIVPPSENDAGGRALVRSRWLFSGAGRADDAGREHHHLRERVLGPGLQQPVLAGQLGERQGLGQREQLRLPQRGVLDAAVAMGGRFTPRFQVLAGGQPAAAPEPRLVLRELYEKYGSSVFGRCAFLLKDRSQAEDAMQDVFAKALQNQAGFRGEASPLTWLMKIATHHCLNLLRSERAGWRKRFEREAKLHTSTEDRPEVIETRDLVVKMLALADLETQAAAIHYHVDEMTLDEVATLLGRSVPTVRKRLEEFAALCGREFSA